MTGNVSDVDSLPPVGRVLIRSSGLLQDWRRGETVVSSVRGRGGIFISYRREETAANAGRLYDRLSERFGEDHVFMDVDSIDIGVDFARAVIEAVVRCNILLALIGRDWSAVTDSKGKRRIDDPDDFVRIEIETALQRDIRVVPVLVDGAALPQANDLPPSLQPLIRRQALELSHAGFRSEISRLVAAVDEVIEAEPGRSADHMAQAETARRRAEDKARGEAQAEAARRQAEDKARGEAQVAARWRAYDKAKEAARRRKRARRMWIVAGILAAIVAIIVVAANSAQHGPPPTVGQLRYDQLQVGDCLTGSNMHLHTNEPWPALVRAVPCDQAHIAEVYYASNYWAADQAYPGPQLIDKQGALECGNAFRSYTGIPINRSQFNSIYARPDSATWGSGDRRLTCIAYQLTSKYPAGAPLYASIRGFATADFH
jgi:hypothetical protein